MFVLLGMTDYVGDTLCGVYSTYENAQDAQKVMSRYDDSRIVEVEVDNDPGNYY